MIKDIKALRIELGLTQPQVIEMLSKQGIEIDKSDYSRIENGMIEKYLVVELAIVKLLLNHKGTNDKNYG